MTSSGTDPTWKQEGQHHYYYVGWKSRLHIVSSVTLTEKWDPCKYWACFVRAENTVWENQEWLSLFPFLPPLGPWPSALLLLGGRERLSTSPLIIQRRDRDTFLLSGPGEVQSSSSTFFDTTPTG